MENSEKYEVELFGQKFLLHTSDGKEHELKKVAEYFKEVVENLNKKLPNRPQLDIVILAGLKITDKLYSLAKSKNVSLNVNDKKVYEIVNDMIKQLDNSLGL